MTCVSTSISLSKLLGKHLTVVLFYAMPVPMWVLKKALLYHAKSNNKLCIPPSTPSSSMNPISAGPAELHGLTSIRKLVNENTPTF